MNTVTGLEQVRQAMLEACAKARRDPYSVTLVAASKTVSAPILENTMAAGQRVFGENRVQEAKAKWPALLDRHPGTELHLIGPLQSNKVRDAVALFDVIHSVDRPSLCAALARELSRQDRKLRLLVQVNTGREGQKGGVLPEEADSFLSACRNSYGFDIEGLMCIPPTDEPKQPHFALLTQIAARNGLRTLSMGMSADFPLAIEMGATHVRVGTAIFGSRSPGAAAAR